MPSPLASSRGRSGEVGKSCGVFSSDMREKHSKEPFLKKTIESCCSAPTPTPRFTQPRLWAGKLAFPALFIHNHTFSPTPVWPAIPHHTLPVRDVIKGLCTSQEALDCKHMSKLLTSCKWIESPSWRGRCLQGSGEDLPFECAPG